MRVMQREYALAERELIAEIGDLVTSLGVPTGLDEADALAERIYPILVERRRQMWALEIAAITDEHPDLFLPEVDFYPLTAIKKLVRRTAGLSPAGSLGVQLELFDPATVKMVKTTVAPWAMPEDAVVVTAMKQRLGAGVARHVKAASRDAVIKTAARNRMRWARQLAGSENCAFCAMLVSRGAVYSEKTVHFKTHDHCDCTATIVPDHGHWDGKEQADELYQLWVDSQGMSDFGKRYREVNGLAVPA